MSSYPATNHVVKISKCKECIFFDESNDGNCVRHGCEHPSIADGIRDINTYWSKVDGWNVKGNTPDWCPLKKTSVNIVWDGDL